MFRYLFNRAWTNAREKPIPNNRFEGTGDESFTLRQNQRYRAMITLTGIESWAGNGTVAAKFVELGFVDAEVTGSGGKRRGEATWPQQDQSVPLPLDPHLSDVEELAPLDQPVTAAVPARSNQAQL